MAFSDFLSSIGGNQGLLRLGANILAAPGSQGALSALGRGVLGAQQFQQEQELLEEEKALRRAKLEELRRKAEERKILQAADGRQRYVDTGEPVFPNATPTSEKFDDIDVVLPDGSRVPTSARYNNGIPEVMTPRGFVPVAQVYPNAVRVEPSVSRQATGGPGDFTKKEGADLREAEIATRNFMATTNDALTLLQENPDINTFTARAAGLVNNIQTEAKAVASTLGLEFDENILDPSKYNESFDQMGIDNARMRSLVVSLAFQAAAASGQTGRSVTERDVKRFITEIGAAHSDPRALSAALLDVAGRTLRNFETRYEVLNNRPFEGDIQVPTVQDTSTMSDEELLKELGIGQ